MRTADEDHPLGHSYDLLRKLVTRIVLYSLNCCLLGSVIAQPKAGTIRIKLPAMAQLTIQDNPNFMPYQTQDTIFETDYHIDGDVLHLPRWYNDKKARNGGRNVRFHGNDYQVVSRTYTIVTYNGLGRIAEVCNYYEGKRTGTHLKLHDSTSTVREIHYYRKVKAPHEPSKRKGHSFYFSNNGLLEQVERYDRKGRFTKVYKLWEGPLPQRLVRKAGRVYLSLQLPVASTANN